jgi:hypothetical protein
VGPTTAVQGILSLLESINTVSGTGIDLTNELFSIPISQEFQNKFNFTLEWTVVYMHCPVPGHD